MIHQRSGGDLQCQTRDRPDRQNETDVELGPCDRCQIGSNEGAPRRLNISDEKCKAIETVKAAPRRHNAVKVGTSVVKVQAVCRSRPIFAMAAPCGLLRAQKFLFVRIEKSV